MIGNQISKMRTEFFGADGLWSDRSNLDNTLFRMRKCRVIDSKSKVLDLRLSSLKI